MKNDITNTSFRGSNKKISSHRYSKGGNTKSNESYLLKNPAEKLNNNKTSHSKGKSFLTLGSAERTWEQENVSESSLTYLTFHIIHSIFSAYGNLPYDHKLAFKQFNPHPFVAQE